MAYRSRVVILEDNPRDIGQLREHLAAHPDISVAAIAETTAAAWQAIREHTPDLVFLDINIRTETDDAGLQLAKWINLMKKPPHIVFLSQYKHYALDASRCHPVVFLTKPINPGELALQLQWIRDHRDEPGGTGGRILVRGKDDKNGLSSFIGVDPKEILLVRSRKDRPNYMEIHLSRGKIITDIKSPLDDFQSKNSDCPLFRAHNRYLVNLDQVHELVLNRFPKSLCLELDGVSLPVARAREKALIAELSDPLLKCTVNGRQVYLLRRDIHCFLNKSGKAGIHLAGGSVLNDTGPTLDEFANALKGKGFCRIHDQCLLNLDYYNQSGEIRQNQDETYELSLAGKPLPFCLSKRSVDDFMRVLRACLQNRK